MANSRYDIKMKTRLFPYINDINLMKELQIDPESIYYISLREDAEKITNIIINSYPFKNNETSKDLVITDATAGVGGNTISFGMHFKYINSIECNYTRFKYLENNIKVYNLKNVNTFNKDCTTILHKLYNDIVFIDPPWGGKDYKYKTKLKLTLSNKAIEDICLDLLKKTTLIILKLPLNYDVDFLYNKLKNFNINVHVLNKMIVITIIKSL